MGNAILGISLALLTTGVVVTVYMLLVGIRRNKLLQSQLDAWKTAVNGQTRQLLLFSGIPHNVEHMRLEEFEKAARMGAYTYYDGSGYFATEHAMSNIQVQFFKGEVAAPIPDFATHVVWFGK